MPEMPLKDLYELKVGDKPQILNFGNFFLEVRRRSDDWHVCLNGNQGDWSCHKYLDYAVGYMVLTYYNRRFALDK